MPLSGWLLLWPSALYYWSVSSSHPPLLHHHKLHNNYRMVFPQHTILNPLTVNLTVGQICINNVYTYSIIISLIDVADL